VIVGTLPRNQYLLSVTLQKNLFTLISKHSNVFSSIRPPFPDGRLNFRAPALNQISLDRSDKISPLAYRKSEFRVSVLFSRCFTSSQGYSHNPSYSLVPFADHQVYLDSPVIPCAPHSLLVFCPLGSWVDLPRGQPLSGRTWPSSGDHRLFPGTQSSSSREVVFHSFPLRRAPKPNSPWRFPNPRTRFIFRNSIVVPVLFYRSQSSGFLLWAPGVCPGIFTSLLQTKGDLTGPGPLGVLVPGGNRPVESEPRIYFNGFRSKTVLRI